MQTLGKDEISEKNVLVVEDEALFRGTLRSSVRSLGYLCTEADSAHAALELLRKTHFSIVISDIVMSEMDGLELLRIIKKRYSSMDVLIVTGCESNHSPLKIVEAGASDFLARPFSKEELGAKLYKIEREKALKNKLYISAITDELTGLSNRRHFYQKLKRETERAKRQGHPLSILMLDVDGFKRFNDRYGHLKGDVLLKTVARVLRLSLREHVDCGFRYGGDEFVVILPEADGKTALSIGNRIKKNFKDTAPGGLTLSMGVAEFQKDFDTETFVHLMDERMYKDKQESKELGQPRLEVDLGKDNYYIRCLNCGGLVHWASLVCENCLADPRKKAGSRLNQGIARNLIQEINRPANDRRMTLRISFRKTFMHDGLLATVHNISGGGVQIKTRRSFSVAELLRIALSLEDGILSFGGNVVYAQSLSDGNLLVGVKFVEISDENSRFLNRFLDSRLLKASRV